MVQNHRDILYKTKCREVGLMIMKGIRGIVKEKHSIGIKDSGKRFTHLKMVCNKKKLSEMKKGV